MRTSVNWDGGLKMRIDCVDCLLGTCCFGCMRIPSGTYGFGCCLGTCSGSALKLVAVARTWKELELLWFMNTS